MDYQLHLGDCLEYMRGMEAGSVDLVFFDPPYGLKIADWDHTFDPRPAFELAWRALAETGTLYATCSAHILAPMMELIPWRRIITWAKPNLPLRKGMNDWEWSTEFVLMATKSDRFVFNKPAGEDARDYWRIYLENGFLRPDDGNHPARKPIKLLERIILASTNPGAVILDPFSGSGTTGAAAMKHGRRFIGCEIDPTYHAQANARIGAALADRTFMLFDPSELEPA